MGEVASEGGAIRSLSEMGAMLTMLTTGTLCNIIILKIMNAHHRYLMQ